MANMATHVQRTWDGLRSKLETSPVEGVAAFRGWMVEDVPALASARLASRVEEISEDHIWSNLLQAPVSELAVAREAWDELRSSLGPQPPAIDPVQLWDWAKDALWSLCVFVDPEEVCDNDQEDLELWWSEREQKAIFVCGHGEHFEFRRQRAGLLSNWSGLDRWSGDLATLVPAPRSVVAELYPDVELLS